MRTKNTQNTRAPFEAYSNVFEQMVKSGHQQKKEKESSIEYVNNVRTIEAKPKEKNDGEN